MKTSEKTKAINLINKINQFSDRVLSTREIRENLILFLNNCGLDSSYVYKSKKNIEEEIYKGINGYHVINNLILKIRNDYGINIASDEEEQI